MRFLRTTLSLLALTLVVHVQRISAAPISDLNAAMAAAQQSVALFKESRATPIRGNPEAKITLTVFGDFDCPNTAKMYPVIQELLRRHPTTLRFIFKMLPIESHPQAFSAARRWAAVRLQAPDTTWAYFDGLFQGRLERRLGDAYYQELGQKLGIDTARLDASLISENVARLVDVDVQEAHAAGINGVPTFLLNGSVVEEGTVPIEFLDSRILELEREVRP